MKLTESDKEIVERYFCGDRWYYHEEGVYNVYVAEDIVKDAKGMYSELGLLAKALVTADKAFRSALQECGRDAGFTERFDEGAYLEVSGEVENDG